MSIDLFLSYSLQLQKLHVVNRNAATTFIGVHWCIQKIYGLVCTV
jgi:hypothetical protein